MSERGVVHGDLMKQNLIIRQGDAKFPIVFIDFGNAKGVEDETRIDNGWE